MYRRVCVRVCVCVCERERERERESECVCVCEYMYDYRIIGHAARKQTIVDSRCAPIEFHLDCAVACFSSCYSS